MLNRNQIILLSLPSLQQSLAVCGLLGKCLWCPSSIPGQIISNLKMRLPAIIARGGFLLCCQVWMLMLRFVGWPLLCCAWRIFPSTVNTSSGSREQPQLCVHDLVAHSAGNSRASPGQKKGTTLCLFSHSLLFFCPILPPLPVLGKCILFPNPCLWQSRGCVSSVWHKKFQSPSPKLPLGLLAQGPKPAIPSGLDWEVPKFPENLSFQIVSRARGLLSLLLGCISRML